MHVNGNQANDKISIKSDQKPKSLHVNQTRWAKLSSFKKLQVALKAGSGRGGGGGLRVMPSDKLDFRVNGETSSAFWHGQRWLERKDATSVCLQQHWSIFHCSDIIVRTASWALYLLLREDHAAEQDWRWCGAAVLSQLIGCSALIIWLSAVIGWW